ncbi:hypothetical protein N5J23_18125 [Comamonas aquatica]|uniref:Uncharacterized protein n=1 Tax=Comamonas aquatica TaxID=225991 RepID=A0AA42W4X6_9BURK|nr:hypothetical protein [Comamonas aquatica]MDH0373738.1 hypothetical protein [Comamonas aquatica]MDH1428806.1 hypothetical protein [Comamonas aquatica]MDH1607679.1 hypothetical protein [Comamonas aquatica]MDH1619435.1 hypothetical protein [Comamonas aquatica]MDH2007417.1 hypothetical protein [Comamonas aquatica]
MTTNSITLTATRVHEIFSDCMPREGEDESRLVRINVFKNYAICNVDRLNAHKDEIALMLQELPISFQANGGGGMSLGHAAMDKHGNQWAREHLDLETLFALGLGVSKVGLMFPPEKWKLLPGGMPYYVVNNNN